MSDPTDSKLHQKKQDGILIKTFTHKVAVVTGAGSGLGRSLALQLAAAGARLALCDVDMAGLEETRRLAQGTEEAISLHHVDVANRERMTEFAAEVLAHHRQVDLLINNAGISFTPTLFDDFSPEQFEKLLNINMWGVYNGTYAFLPHLRTRPEASIVNVASLAGLVGLYGYTPYSMSKFAVRGLSEALQSELVGSTVSLTIVYPGGIKTDLIKHAPDLAEAQREAAHENFSRAALLTSDNAARKILKAVQKRKNHLVLGNDAKFVNNLRKLFGQRFPSVVNAIFSKAMFGSGTEG